MPKNSSLAETFVGVINQTVDRRPVFQDQTIQADIVKLINADNGEYRVSYQGNTFFAYSNDTSVTYKEGQQVLVLVPSGDFDQRKIIIGSAKNNLTYTDKLDMMNFYTDAGPNWFSPDMYQTTHDNLCGICACPEDQEVLLVDPANYLDQYFQRTDSVDDLEADAELQWYAGMYEYVKIQANFRTEFSSTHSVGEYSLRVVCEYSNPDYIPEGTAGHDPDIPQYLEITWELGFDTFTGSPYQYSQDTPQTAYFKVSKGLIKRLKRVELCQNGKFLFDIVPTYTSNGSQIESGGSKVVDRNNIFCSNIDIRFAEKVNLNDGLYHAWIETPLGDRVYKQNPDTGGKSRPYVDLVPHLYYMNQDLIGDCEVLWFRRNSSVMKQDATIDDVNDPSKVEDNPNKDKIFNNLYTDYTGPGWEIIDNVLDDGFGTKWNEVLDDGQTLRVYLEGVVWQWDYKVVCLYRTVNGDGSKTLILDVNSQPQAEHTVVNASYDAAYSLIVADETSKAGQRILFVNNLKRSVKELDLITDPSGQTLNRMWYCTWYLSSSDGSYFRITDEMAEDPVNITKYLTKDILIFRVRAWDPYLVNPGNGDTFLSMAPIGELEYTIVNTTDNAVAYWTGDRSFNYDADGKACDSIGEIYHSVQLHVEFPAPGGTSNAGGGSYSVVFRAPDNTILGTLESYANEDNPALTKGYTPPNNMSMMKDMFVSDNNTIQFKVLDQYDGGKTENTFYAEIKYAPTSEIYRVDCPITFTQDGQQGTQGSDWAAPIYSCNVNPSINTNYLNQGDNVTASATGAQILTELQTIDANLGRQLVYASILDTLVHTEWPPYDANNHVVIDNGLTFDILINDINENLQSLNTTVNADERDCIQRYYDFRMGEVGSQILNDIIPSYMQRNEMPTPLILIPKDPNDLSKGWKQDPNCHVVFRPFVSKAGVSVESMNPHDGYYYKVWWDVRFDQRHKKAPYGSFLRLHHLDAADPNDSMYKWVNDSQVNHGNGYEYGNATPGNAYEYLSPDSGLINGRTADSIANYYSQANGLIGYNAYPSTSMTGTNNEFVKEQYGAVEVRFADDQDWNQFNFDDGQYVFFIKARIEVYAGGWNEAQNRLSVNTTSNEGLVATITSWHPVDVFLNPGGINFEPQKLHMNWPSFVIYDSNGRNPKVTTDSKGRIDLIAYYSNNSYDYTTDLSLYIDRSDETGTDEANSNSKKLLAKVINNTPDICSLVTSHIYVKAANGGGQIEGENISQEVQSYKPTEYMTWQYGMITSLRTPDEGICDETGQDPWKGGIYIRCQIMTLNHYGNSAINGWDGQSISLDKEKGVILAPTIGAGYKDKATNLFSGVIMGIDTQWKKQDLVNNWSEDMRLAFGYDDADIKNNPYMAGLYGYSKGVSTFGLMENGTAFFGRADRGGRIIIDGYNATIYGGANGWYDKPAYNDPMWNTMRLSFVDLYHQVSPDGSNGPILGFEGEFYQDKDFPNWLKRSWRNAYVVQEGYLPYWFQGGSDKKGATLEDVTYWFQGQEDFDNYCEMNKNTSGGIAEKIKGNARINYWDNGFEYQPWTIKSFMTWLATTSYTIPELDTSITNEKNRLNRLYKDWDRLIYSYVRYLLQQWDLDKQYSSSQYGQFDSQGNNDSTNSERQHKNAIARECYSEGNWDDIVANVLGLDTTVAIPDRIQPYASDTNTKKVLTAYVELGKIYANIDQNQFQHIGHEDYTAQQQDSISAAKQVILNAETAASDEYETLMQEYEKQMQQTIEGTTGDPQKPEVTLPRREKIYFDDNYLINDCIITKQQSVFGPSRASSTPAIEIGQHIHGLRPGRLSIHDYKDVMSNLEVPGDRNFLVTYDGTMWSMNGIFMGNVVGSNIVGGSIVGGDLAIGELDENAVYYAVDDECDWRNLLAPTQSPRRIVDETNNDGAAEIGSDGGASFSYLNIYGGNINIGGFHIIGYNPQSTDFGENYDKMGVDAGHLVQFGESDFVGPSHFYGNVGIGPNRREDPGASDYNDGKAHSNLGNFFQTYGQVGMAVMIPNNNLTFHQLVAGTDGFMSNNGKVFKYEGRSMPGEGDDPLVNNAAHECLEGYAMFGLDSTHDGTDYITQGHFWPLAFKYHEDGISYITTMNMFRHYESDGIVEGSDDPYPSNYFRVGPQGPEANQVFFYDGFRNEYSTEKPDPYDNGENTIGFVGNRSLQRWLDTGWANKGSSKFAIGLSSWKGNHLVTKSDMDSYNYARSSYRIYASAYGGDNVNNKNDTWSDATDNFGAYLQVGEYQTYGTSQPITSIQAVTTRKGLITLGVRGDDQPATGSPGGHIQSSGYMHAGVEINPFNQYPDQWRKNGQQHEPDPSQAKGVFIYTHEQTDAKSGIHIVAYQGAQGACCNPENDSEVYVSNKLVSLYNNTKVTIGVQGGTAHVDPTQGMMFQPNRVEFVGYTAEQQFNIYARFA